MTGNRYNSVLFATRSATDYGVILVSPQFLEGGPWSKETWFGYLGANQIIYMQNNINSLQRLGNAACIQAYSGELISDWGDVLVVSSQTNHTETIFNVFTSYLDKPHSGPWQCMSQSVGATSCDLNSLAATANTWQLPSQIFYNSTEGLSRTDGQNVPVQYCLAKSVKPACSVGVSFPILVVVIVCNSIKVICLLLALLTKFQPLVTVGDAIASFMARPDDSTYGHCNLSALNVRDGDWKPNRYGAFKAPAIPKAWKSYQYRWRSGASAQRWVLCSVL